MIAISAASVHAGQTWDGGGVNDNWTSPANWDGDVGPNFANPITFQGETRTNTLNNRTADSVVGGINLTNDGSVGKTAAFNFSQNRLTLGGNIVTTASSSTITDSIDFDMIFNGGRTINTGADHNLTITGIISQDGTNRNLTKQGVGTLTLSNAANTFAGQFLSDAGTTQVTKLENNGTASSLGAGAASFRLGNDATATLEYIGNTDSSSNKVVQIGTGTATNTGSAAILNNGTGKLTFTAANFTAAVAGVTVARSLTLGGSYAAAANEITGVIRDTNTAGGGIVSLTKEGASTWALSGTNTYTGNTTINAGTLALGASGTIATSPAIVVGSGATFEVSSVAGFSVGASQELAGSGTVNGAVAANGTISPGVTGVASGVGTISFANDLSLASGSFLGFQLDGTDFTVGGSVNDLISASGDLTLDGTLNVTALNSFASATVGNTWRLFNYSGTLTDNNLALGTMPTLGAGLSFSIDTSTANQVNLVVVPEPSLAVAGLLGLGWAGLTGLRKRSRNKS
ncbi:MAG: hypothetical protein RLZZ440_2457 [Planctomycetota bacterium]